MVYSRKKQTGGLIYLFTLPMEIPDKSKLHPWKLFKIVFYIAWKFPDQKPIPLENPHNFFLVTPGNSTYPQEVPYPQPLSLYLFFFLEQTNVKTVCIFFFHHLILVGISSILILSVSVKSRGWAGKRFFLHGKNSLSVMKVIYLQSLN